MTADTTPGDIFGTITDALLSTNEVLSSEDRSVISTTITDGISLLDGKNDLLLSYLQHLVFLVLLRVRHSKDPSKEDSLGRKVISKLIELRAYLDRGVRPLETRLRYQIDKVLRASDEADRADANKQPRTSRSATRGKKSKIRGEEDHGSDVSAVGSNSDADGSEDSEDEHKSVTADSDDETTTRPNTSALAAAVAAKTTQAQAQANARTPGSSSSRLHPSDRTAVYKPPRISATAMPEHNINNKSIYTTDQEQRLTARKRKNALLEEYLDEEHGSAPAVQSSIGANNTILDRGRTHTTLSHSARAEERERAAYEEANFVRLPAASKVEKRREKARERAMGGARDVFGGEDWTGLGGLGERITRDVGVERGESRFERREKRKRDTVDLPRGDGVGGSSARGEVGAAFEKRRRVVQGRVERRGRGRGR